MKMQAGYERGASAHCFFFSISRIDRLYDFYYKSIIGKWQLHFLSLSCTFLADCPQQAVTVPEKCRKKWLCEFANAFSHSQIWG